MDLTHKHWALIFIGILVAAFVVLAAWYAFGSKTAMAPSETATSTIPVTATSTPPAPPAHITEHAAYYDIDLTYPSKTPLSGDANIAAIASMRAEMQIVANEFKKNGDFANLTQEDIKMMRLDERKEALASTYETYTGARTISYVFEIYEDTLGAHPNAYYRTFTFDTTTGAELSLDKVFSSSGYLKILSDIARSKLPAIVAKREQVSVSEVDTDYIMSGIAPEPEAYQSWYISGKNFVVVFPPYQVGPYALGTIELPIPLSQLSSSLKAEYR